MGFFDFLKDKKVKIRPVDVPLTSGSPSLKSKSLASGGSSNARPISVDKRGVIKSRGLTHFSSNGSYEWVPPQYDHYLVELLFDIETLFSRATRAKLSLFMREGYNLIGSDEAKVSYLQTRLKQIEFVSSIPFDITLMNVARDLFVHSNAYLLKVRSTEASGGKERQVNTRTIKPVAAYFSLPPECIVAKVDRNGNIIGWKLITASCERLFSVDDIIHFSINKKAGYHLGVPAIVPIIDDIRALRTMEANLEVLIHKHLFPITLWRVGTEKKPASVYPKDRKSVV
jgi:hypothetical protein